MLEVQEYTPTRRPRGKRIVCVKKNGEVVLQVATYQMLRDELNFTNTDMKKICQVLSGERPTIKGYTLHNLGFLIDA